MAAAVDDTWDARVKMPAGGGTDVGQRDEVWGASVVRSASTGIRRRIEGEAAATELVADHVAHLARAPAGGDAALHSPRRPRQTYRL